MATTKSRKATAAPTPPPAPSPAQGAAGLPRWVLIVRALVVPVGGLVLGSFPAGMEISRKLAERDPSNALWQTDLAVPCWTLSQLVDTPALTKNEQRRCWSEGWRCWKGCSSAGG